MIQSFNPPPLSPELAREVKRALLPGETVLWAARPSRGRLLQRTGIALGGGLFFVIIGLAVVLTATRSGGWPLAAVGLATGVFLGSWFIWQSLKTAEAGRKTAYIVTDQRVVFLTADGSVQSLTPAEAQVRTVKRQVNGSGDIYFSAWEKTIASSDGDYTERNGFLGIADVQAVDDLLRQTFG